MRKEVEAVLQRAASQIGVREEGRNRGARVETYLAEVDCGPGAPWCAAFVYWSIATGLEPMEIPNPYVKSAYCPTIAQWAEDEELLSPTPEPGDTFLLLAGGRARHTGFVASVTTTTIVTVEGNTNLDGSAEGDGVYRRTRPRNGSLLYVRWERLLPRPAPVRAEFALILQGKPFGSIPVENGRALCPVRRFGEFLGYAVAWDADSQLVTFNGRPVGAPLFRIDGVSHAPVRALAEFAGMGIRLDAEKRTIRLFANALSPGKIPVILTS